jgi:hypothetical protein
MGERERWSRRRIDERHIAADDSRFDLSLERKHLGGDTIRHRRRRSGPPRHRIVHVVRGWQGLAILGVCSDRRRDDNGPGQQQGNRINTHGVASDSLDVTREGGVEKV